MEGKVYLDDKLNTADVVLTVDPGPLSFFGPTRVADSPETPDYVIKRKMAFKEGEIFDLRKIYESQKNLYKLDLFSSVAVTPEEVPADESNIPIDVKVKETKKRSVTAALGWGSLDQFRATGGLRVRNLFGGGRLLDFHGQYSRINSEFDVTLTNPQIFASHYDLIISSGLFYRQYPSFYNKTISLQARLERELRWHIKGYAGYLIQFDKPFNIPGTVEYVFYPVPQDQTFRTSEAFFGFRRNTTDDIAYPTQGSQQLLHFELAPTFLGSGYQVHRRPPGRPQLLRSVEKRNYSGHPGCGRADGTHSGYASNSPLSPLLYRRFQLGPGLSLLYSGSDGYCRQSHRRPGAAGS